MEEMPSRSTMEGIMAELRKAMASIPDTQQRLMELSGTAWSADRTVKVVVGPRGQLVDLEIDPRVFRRPDAYALRSAILTAASQAVSQVVEKSQELMYDQLPPEVAELRERFQPGRPDPVHQAFRSDADIVAERKVDRE
ncbi:YbaB/EbfC family nucleoid-associated protein [Prauserella cavernicola]|uniref:YbaB/EbfC family nucleoid-associated protein n=1 Tax=Prauserella cavernicola TaxID=2800127 RepID=A0A934V4D3_9PSEU|nr:YbaB/EbfC family nucleoid-associated protein [Prauserella cavernicola]MBK1783463.1 YbaB/EbfC family nucleoid-associated protein [Prauserella cavernicola]